MKINKQRIIGISILLGVAIFLIVKVFAPDLLRKTSDEMVYLRSVEQSLQLSDQYSERKERDEGETRDYKGAIHYTRDIWVHYKNEATIEEIHKSLIKNGWEVVDTREFGDYKFTRGKTYLKEGVEACISTTIYDQTIHKNQYDHFIAIEAPRELGCEIFYFGSLSRL